MRLARLAAWGLLTPCLLLAHGGGPLQPDDLWSAWELDPGVVALLALAAICYARGARVSRGASLPQMLAFWAGLTVLAAALISPLHPLGEVLFSAHMAQHEILMLVAAPLLVFSRPLVPMLWGLPLSLRRAAGAWAKIPPFERAWHWVTRPFNAWWLHALALWVWHIPVLFQATLRNDWIHTSQHLSFLLSALGFWWSLFYARGHAQYGMAVVYIFTTAVHTGILGALLTFAPAVIYPAYSTTAPLWGLTPLQDQQIGGLIMWVPAGVVYMTVGLLLFASWLRESQTPLQGKYGAA